MVACIHSGVTARRCVSSALLLEYVCMSESPSGLRMLAEELIGSPHILKIVMGRPRINTGSGEDRALLQ
ncbi:MAG: hypothetical protein JWR14_3696 [Caballeronia sp.]|jgi:hypothetical protein|nr:hypothetical protein [Caballeronia sp.]